MKTFKILAIVLAIVMLSTMFTACDNSNELGKIVGTVVDANGNPLEGVTVTVVDGDNFAETTVKGIFTLRNVAIGKIKISLSLKGYETTEYTIKKTKFKQGIARPNITLKAGKGSVSGFVYLSGDVQTTIPNATLTMGDTTVTADDKGAFTFNDVTMLKAQTIIVSANGYIDATKTITIRSYNKENKATVNIGISRVPITVKGVGGLSTIAVVDEVNDDEFSAQDLKDKWTTGGPVNKVNMGVQLNCGDPWKAQDYSSKYQDVVSYMYVIKDITEDNSFVTVTAGIENLDEVKDGAQDNKSFFPYITLIVLDDSGKVKYKGDWTKVEVASNGATKEFDFDLSDVLGDNMVVMVACNVGYRATITKVEFSA